LSRFQQLGYRIGGFRACICSDVPVGSGLSSSASIEVLIATILNALYNDGRADALQVALIAQYAEKVYFGKPCGLMDQITSVTGGVVKIDFGDPDLPLIEKVEFDFSAAGTSLVVVETGGSHANLTGDYAAIPKEMRTVASLFGREVCRQISREELLSRIAELRSAAGVRAILRALHVLEVNHRVDRQVESLRRGNIREFLRLIEESGNSSYRWLQNCVAPGVGHEQGIPLALALAEGFLRGCGGACRVHGGGFAGTILAFLPRGELGSFTALMESAFGSGCVRALQVRAQGSLELR
jgi:galactokinase